MISRYAGNQKGSSSVLVVLTLLMLVIFGVLGMMSSYSGFKIAEKNASWTKDYYRFEAEANKRLFEISPVLETMKQQAEAYYRDWTETGQFAAVDDAILKKTLEEQNLGHYSGFDAMAVLFGTTVKHKWETGDEKGAIVWSTTGDRFELLYVETIVLESGRTYVLALDLLPQQGGVFQVVKWKEVPATFDYSDGMEFEDVEVIGS